MEIDKEDFSTYNGLNKKKSKLILHVDLRNTILVADSVTSTTVEQGLNSYMTCVAWGKVNENSEWRWINDKLSVEPPDSNAISYYSYLESKLVRNARNRAALRKATGDFTQTPIGSQFYDIFEKHRKILEWKHNNVQYLTLANSYHYALPSFLECLYKLQEDKRDYSVIIRTYGLDARNMLKALHSTTKGNHPSFKSVYIMELF
ncbi:unnamed protein product [Dimorphilus gyrociliatus]|uniref:Uncharacterized protein n=1 Tax=Dimorphilus gyrociliatus TaxID=2664684 RepID=A0A7I8VP91_9ANNE|nr:unnamed protein product [Dimorphilus gyrociliatus]